MTTPETIVIVGAGLAGTSAAKALPEQRLVTGGSGGIDVVVHTAGIMLLGPWTELNLADFHWMHRVPPRRRCSSTARTKPTIDHLATMAPLGAHHEQDHPRHRCIERLRLFCKL